MMGQAAARQSTRQRPEPPLWRKLSAELLGAFALTLVASGGEVIGALSGQAVGHVAKTLAPGLVIMALIYTYAEISGAHFNPAVTLGFALHGAFAWRKVPGYWLAQIAGALLAGGCLRLVFGAAAADGVTRPETGFSAEQALVMEIILTWLLVSVILGTAQEARLVGNNTGLAVGATIALCGLFAGPVSDASMNPALSLGPALVNLRLATIWLYLLGPTLGSALAVGTTLLTHGRPKRAEARKAQGGG